VTTILRNFVPKVVSAITQTPASGPLELVTTPPMLSASTETLFPAACAAAGFFRGAASIRTIAAKKNKLKTTPVIIIADLETIFPMISPFHRLDSSVAKKLE
jgi:hypothetical protein